MARRFRGRGIGDLIPTSGEGRALVEVKGRVGGKGGGMGMRRRRFFRNSIRNPAAELHGWPLANINWSPTNINLVWRPTNVDAVGVQRICQVTATDLGGNEEDPEVFVKRLQFDAHFIAGIGRGRINGGDIQNWEGAVRDDIPATSEGWPDTTGYTGPLLSGTINTSTMIGPTSQAEGLPFNLALTYEDVNDSTSDPAALYENVWDDINGPRNKRYYWSRQYCPTLYNPAHVRINKVFPGRGVRLSVGKREISALSLIIYGYTGMGTTVMPCLSFALHQSACWYFESAR